MPNTTQSVIETIITKSLNPVHLEIINESSNHSVPKGSESHFKLTVVSDEFSNLTLVERHRKVNELLDDILKNKIHALALHTYTPEQWAIRNQPPSSPQCMGGNGM